MLGVFHEHCKLWFQCIFSIFTQCWEHWWKFAPTQIGKAARSAFIWRRSDAKVKRTFVGEISGWMRYDGYHLTGHTRMEVLSVPYEESCWRACLQETTFDCLSVAYVVEGNRSCLLYGIKALTSYTDWTNSSEFTYYEYCANGNTEFQTSDWA